MIPQIPLLKYTLTGQSALLQILPSLIQLQHRVVLFLDRQHKHQLLVHMQRLPKQQPLPGKLVLLELANLLNHPKDCLSSRGHKGQSLGDLGNGGDLGHAERVDQNPPVKLGQKPGPLALKQTGLLALVVGLNQSEGVLGEHGVLLDRGLVKGVEGDQLAVGGRADECLVLSDSHADDGGWAHV